MSLFEFIIGMISVILALAVAQLFLGVAELMQARDRVKFFLPHTIWNINLFLITFVHWWSLWTFKDLSWNFAMFFYSLLGPSLMFFAAVVINPRNRVDADINIADHFHGIRRMFLAVIVGMLVLFSLDGPLFGTEPPVNGIRIAQLSMASALLWGLFSDSRLAQSIASLVMLTGTSAVVIIRFLPGQG